MCTSHLPQSENTIFRFLRSLFFQALGTVGKGGRAAHKCQPSSLSRHASAARNIGGGSVCLSICLSVFCSFGFWRSSLGPHIYTSLTPMNSQFCGSRSSKSTSKSHHTVGLSLMFTWQGLTEWAILPTPKESFLNKKGRCLHHKSNHYILRVVINHEILLHKI